MRSSDRVLAGWVVTGGILRPGDQVAAYAARGQSVRGVCNTRGCRRRVDLDPKELCGQGLGLLSMEKVKQLYRCARLDTCCIDFSNEPMALPLQLEDLTGRPNVRIRLRCTATGCTFVRVWLVEQMIAGLESAKKGSGRTAIHDLPKLMTAGCGLCKRVAWAADVLWANMDTVGWRAQGARVFDEMGKAHV